jgi:hypothetical protein
MGRDKPLPEYDPNTGNLGVASTTYCKELPVIDTAPKTAQHTVCFVSVTSGNALFSAPVSTFNVLGQNVAAADRYFSKYRGRKNAPHLVIVKETR